MTPNLSLNEIELTVRKAAIACGWPYGLAEEFGRAALWAAERKIAAICEIIELAKPGPAMAEPRVEGSRLVFPEGAAALVSALDCLAGKQADEVAVRAAGGLPGMAAFAGAAAKSYGLEFEAVWGEITLIVAGPACCRLPEGRAAPEGSLTLRSWAAPLRSAPTTLADESPMEHSCWAEAVALAGKTLVPETDASREQGAGAGLLDND